MLSFLFPPICPLCAKELLDKGEHICKICSKKQIFIKEPTCYSCGKSMKNQEKNIAVIADSIRRILNVVWGYVLPETSH